MSLATVKNEWSLFQDLWEIWTAALEEKIVLNSPDSPVRSFPKNDKSQWLEWIREVKEVLSVRENLEVTDTALREGTDLLALHQKAAAAVSVGAPTSDADVKNLLEKLEAVNEEIKKDNNFHAVLDIGEALAGAIKQAQTA